MSRYQNVFHKNPKIGIDLMNRLLRKEISARRAVEIFNENGIPAKERNVQTIIKNIRDSGQSTSDIISIKRERKKAPQTAGQQITTITREYEKMDLSKIPDVDVIKLLDKHIYDLENLLLNFPSDIVVQKNIIELEMKIAEKIYKMRPTSTDFDINALLRRNDWSTEFILIHHEELKDEYLSFMSKKQQEEAQL